jgi:hypothetical protein
MCSQAPDWLILPGASRAVLIDSSDWSTKRGGGEEGSVRVPSGWHRGGGGGGEGGGGGAGATWYRENSSTCSNVLGASTRADKLL